MPAHSQVDPLQQVRVEIARLAHLGAEWRVERLGDIAAERTDHLSAVFGRGDDRADDHDVFVIQADVPVGRASARAARGAPRRRLGQPRDQLARIRPQHALQPTQNAVYPSAITETLKSAHPVSLTF